MVETTGTFCVNVQAHFKVKENFRFENYQTADLFLELPNLKTLTDVLKARDQVATCIKLKKWGQINAGPCLGYK